ncbi:MAG: hypothetical protein WB723_06395 [Candidatus Acidiferrales bacterium]
MTAHQENQRFGFRSFMVKHQYKVMSVSLFVGFSWVGIYHLVGTSWFFSRLSLLLAIICFVPAGIVLLVHLREFGPFLWWDRSDVVLTTRRAPKLEKAEFIAMAILWAVIFVFVVVVIFFLSR